MRDRKAHIGIATDGDADRFGIVDEDGTFIQPNYIIALLFDYLVETRGWKNGVAKTVATTNLINAARRAPQGPAVRNAGRLQVHRRTHHADKIAIGGEETAGLTIRGHVPEKDGVIAGLLCCEMVATRGKTLGAAIEGAVCQGWFLLSVRENFHLTPEVKGDVH